MDPRLLRLYEAELAYHPRDGRRVRPPVPEDRRPTGPRQRRGRRPLCGAAAGGVCAADRARAAQDRGGIPDLHAVAAADGLSALPGAHAVDGGGAVQPGATRCAACRRARCCRPARSCAACSAPKTRPTANSAPATKSSCCRSRSPMRNTSPRRAPSPPSVCRNSAACGRRSASGCAPPGRRRSPSWRSTGWRCSSPGRRARGCASMSSCWPTWRPSMCVRPSGRCRGRNACRTTRSARSASIRMRRCCRASRSRSTATGCCRNTTRCRSGSCSSSSANSIVRWAAAPARSWTSCCC